MKRWSYFIFSALIVISVFSSSGFAQMNELTTLKASEVMDENGSASVPESGQDNVSHAAVDFESYQRNIDDIFQISLLSNPNMNSGLNNVIIDLNRKIAANPENPESLISLAHVYRIIGQPKEANRFYKKALALDPDNFHVNVFSGLISYNEQNYDQALERLSQAIKLNPTDMYPRLGKAHTLMLMHRDKDAEKEFLEILKMQPEHRQASFALSLLYQRMGKAAEAMKILKKMNEENPEDLFASYHIGALYLSEGKPEEALKHWNEVYRSGARDPQFLTNLSIAYLRNKEPEKAEKILEHLIFFQPGEHVVDVLLAESYRQLGMLDEAERRYRLILIEKPDFYSAYMGLAQVLAQQGRKDESDEMLRAAASFMQQGQEEDGLESERSFMAQQAFEATQ